jgi:hypothetical protein
MVQGFLGWRRPLYAVSTCDSFGHGEEIAIPTGFCDPIFRVPTMSLGWTGPDVN